MNAMSYKFEPHEFESVYKLAPEDRLHHFFKRVANWEEVWSLFAAQARWR